jgi:hypothetical protein
MDGARGGYRRALFHSDFLDGQRHPPPRCASVILQLLRLDKQAPF